MAEQGGSIRAAIAVAQGWQLARGVKLLGVGSADALAAQAQAEEQYGPVNVLIEAQRGEFYLGEWQISADKRVEIGRLRIVPAAEVAARTAAGVATRGASASRSASSGARPTAPSSGRSSSTR